MGKSAIADVACVAKMAEAAAWVADKAAAQATQAEAAARVAKMAAEQAAEAAVAARVVAEGVRVVVAWVVAEA